MEKTAHVTISGIFVAYVCGRFQKCMRSCQTQKANGVEEIGLPHGIRSGNARERPQVHVNINEVLESTDLQACDHGRSILDVGRVGHIP
jgi:hypothetical protein